MKFAVFYGVPTYREDNTWLHEELSKYGETRVLEVSDFWYRLGRWHPRSKCGIILHFLMYIAYSFIIMARTDKNDVIITRDHGSSLVLAWIISKLNIKRVVVAFNWIENPKSHYRKLAYDALKIEDYIPVVNNCKLIKQLQENLKIKKDRIIFFPDIYNAKEKFKVPDVQKERYIFSGGVNNRDWDLLFKVAEVNKDKKFKIVANKYFWNYKGKCELNNVTMYYDLAEEEYYQIMKNAYLTLIPLKEDKVSGLINIIRSHQYGVPCITNNVGSTALYYPSKYKENMLYSNDNKLVDLNKKINYLYTAEADIYFKIATDLQAFLKVEFSPKQQVYKLFTILDNWYNNER